MVPAAYYMITVCAIDSLSMLPTARPIRIMPKAMSEVGLNLRLCAGKTTAQSTAVLKKDGHIAFILNENIPYLRASAG